MRVGRVRSGYVVEGLGEEVLNLLRDRVSAELRAVMNVKDLDVVALDAVPDDKRQRSTDEFTSSDFAAIPAARGRSLQGLDDFEELFDGWLRQARIAPGQIVPDILQVVCRRRSPADSHSGLKHALNAGFHLVLFNELATIGLSDTLPNGRAESSILQQPLDGIFDKMLRVGS